MGSMNPTISVVIPAHNEEATIGTVVGLVCEAVPAAEVLVVDDGSADRTSEVATAAGARVVRLPVNEGKGAAVRHGLAAATGDVMVLIDADGQDNPFEIPLLVGAFASDVDLVLGSRFLGQFRPGAITRLNYLGTKFITLTVRLLFGHNITDPLAGFRAISRPALGAIDLQATGYDIEVDMLLRVVRAGGRVAEVPASRSPRRHGASDLSSIRDGLRIFRRIVQVRFESQPAPRVIPAAVETATLEPDR